MLRKEEKKGGGGSRGISVVCPICRSKHVDGKVYGEGGRYQCRKCQTIFTIEATPKKS